MKSNIVNLLVKSKAIELFNRYTRDNSIVFMLHRFSDPSINYSHPESLEVEIFEMYINYLLDNRYTIISGSQLLDAFDNGETLHKTVMFTIDDGYIDTKNVLYPIFKKYQLPAVIFLTTDFISGKLMMWWDKIEYLLNATLKEDFQFDFGQGLNQYDLKSITETQNGYNRIVASLKKIPDSLMEQTINNLAANLEVDLPLEPPVKFSALSWDDVIEMVDHKIEFGAHTVTHPILARLTPNEQRNEIMGSIKRIHENCGIKPDIFCYPNGGQDDFNEDTISILREEKVRAAFSAIYGFVSVDNIGKNANYIYKLRRMPIPVNFNNFVQYVSGFEAFKFSIRK